MFVLSNEFYNGIEENESARKYVEANVEYWKIAPLLVDCTCAMFGVSRALPAPLAGQHGLRLPRACSNTHSSVHGSCESACN